MARPTKNYCDYFPHDRDMRNHRKIKAVRTKFGVTGYAIWSMVLEYLTGIDGNEFENSETEIELMGGDFGVSVTEIRQVLDYCIRLELLFEKDGFIHSESLDDRLNIVYEKRNRNKSKSKKQLRINGKFATSNTASNGVSVTEMPQSKVNKSKVNEIIDNGTWESEKRLFLNAEQWQMKQCSYFSISREVLIGSLNTFLERLENQEDFKSEKELKRHFPNWFEKIRGKINGNGSLVSPSEQERLDKLNSFKPIRD